MPEIPEEAKLTDTPYDINLDMLNESISSCQEKGESVPDRIHKQALLLSTKQDVYRKAHAAALASPEVSGLVDAVKYFLADEFLADHDLELDDEDCICIGFRALATFKAFKGE